jgi:hypothetical protein
MGADTHVLSSSNARSSTYTCLRDIKCVKNTDFVTKIHNYALTEIKDVLLCIFISSRFMAPRCKTCTLLEINPTLREGEI